jgi:UDP-GlcNAc:undecaprenyl-phosphate GlcNAc-1-phosphate transferase
LLAFGGATFEPLSELGPVVVVLAVPFLTNAMNIVDGQDGLATGLALIAASGISAIAATQGDVQAIGPALIGALLGFLLWNRPPASVFLGDGGAYAIGCMLAVLAVDSSRSWESLLGTFLCLGVLALEMVSTVIRRVFGRTPLLSGDRAHAYDLMAGRLRSRKRATAGMWAAGAFAAVLGWLVARSPLPVAIAVVAATVAAGSVAVVGLWRTELRRSR